MKLRYFFWLGLFLLLPVSTGLAQDGATPTRPLTPGDTVRGESTHISNWLLLVIVLAIFLLTIGLFLAYFPKGYRDAKRAEQQQDENIETNEPLSESPPPAPRVIFLSDDQE